jgi:hypothetical protein
MAVSPFGWAVGFPKAKLKKNNQRHPKVFSWMQVEQPMNMNSFY